MGWLVTRVFLFVIPVEAGIRHSAQRMGYNREMGSRFRGNDEEGWEADGLLLDRTIPKEDSRGLLFVLQSRPWLTLGYAGSAPSRRKPYRCRLSAFATKRENGKTVRQRLALRRPRTPSSSATPAQ